MSDISYACFVFLCLHRVTAEKINIVDMVNFAIDIMELATNVAWIHSYVVVITCAAGDTNVSQEYVAQKYLWVSKEQDVEKIEIAT